MNSCCLHLLFCLFGLAPSQTKETEMIRLKNGDFLFAQILAHSEQGIRLKRADTGGVVDLPWHYLFAQEEQRLRQQFHYLDQSNELVVIEAQQLVLEDGNEYIGVILSEDTENIFLQIHESIIPIAKQRLQGPVQTVQINALEVFSRDQLYAQKVAELVPKTAADYLELARFLVRIRDFQRALQAYQECQALEANFHPQEVSHSIARLKVQAGRQEEIAWLDQIEMQYGRKKYLRAKQLCEEFISKWPNSSFFEEVTSKSKHIEIDHFELLRQTVVRAWYSAAEKLSGQKAIHSELHVDQARAYAQGELSNDILAKVTKEAQEVMPQITVQEVLQIWKQRDVLAKVHRAVYGDGTFLLGREQARQGFRDESVQEDGNAQGEQELRERVRRYLREYGKGRNTQVTVADDEDAKRWWRGARISERQQWLLAYYVEFSGDMKEVRPFFSLCRTCGGKGDLTILNSGQGRQSSIIACPTCYRIQVRRGVYYQ